MLSGSTFKKDGPTYQRSRARHKPGNSKKTSDFEFQPIHRKSLTKDESKVISYISRRSTRELDPVNYDNVTFLDVGGLFCTLGELRESMVPRGQMTTQVIRTIAAFLNKKSNQPNSPSPRFIIDPSFMQPAIFKWRKDGVDVEEYDITFPSFIMRLEDIENKLMNGTNWQRCSICKAFQMAFSAIDNSFSMEGWEFYSAEVPKQPHGHSCGHYMLVAISLGNGYWICIPSEHIELYFANRAAKMVAEILLGDENDCRGCILEFIENEPA